MRRQRRRAGQHDRANGAVNGGSQPSADVVLSSAWHAWIWHRRGRAFGSARRAAALRAAPTAHGAYAPDGSQEPASSNICPGRRGLQR
ncbi:MAG: hypothetical protein IBX64_12490 [Actinobacteria bacterium]|nr:hypothetical protein [Actinomycetota bacterium]